MSACPFGHRDEVPPRHMRRVAEKVAAMLELIEQHSDAMDKGSLIVVTRSRVRMRQRERAEGGGA